MNQEFLSERRKALEEAFFANQNKTLLQRLRETDAARQKKAALAAASGISDDNVLEKLVALNIGSDTLTALSLVPIVKMAWADGAIDDKERKAALSAAAEIGLSNDSVRA
jgi:DnaJ-domain-containing protein 1